jgi:hypothetical protein
MRNSEIAMGTCKDNRKHLRIEFTTEVQLCFYRYDPSGPGVKFTSGMEWFLFFSIYEHHGKKNFN